ncbi:hypothetical protein DDN40_16810 [Vibrio cholerae]|nr:hypothetical protein [Vibrio cholerae]
MRCLPLNAALTDANIFKCGDLLLNKIGVLIYWLSCIYIFSHLFLMNSWLQFFDAFSIICTFVPAIFSLLIIKGRTLVINFSIFLKVMWFSAGLTTFYGIILTLSNLTVEYEALAAGFSVAILPIFYAFGASLLLLPLIVQD